MTEPADINMNPKEAVRSLQIMFGALVGAVVFFAIAVVLLHLINGPIYDTGSIIQSNLMVTAVGVVAAACMLGARSYYKKTMAMGEGTLYLLSDKLNHYRAAFIIYMALCEGPAIFSVIILLLTGKFIVLIITALLLAMMWLKVPTRSRIIQELKLDWREKELI
ncbi:MAG: hypothetical protein NTW29_02205 [Bacteroidetes bacterium]|nr:hypothetical protein [Bacteroidota bacterium]